MDPEGTLYLEEIEGIENNKKRKKVAAEKLEIVRQQISIIAGSDDSMGNKKKLIAEMKELDRLRKIEAYLELFCEQSTERNFPSSDITTEVDEKTVEQTKEDQEQLREYLKLRREVMQKHISMVRAGGKNSDNEYSKWLRKREKLNEMFAKFSENTQRYLIKEIGIGRKEGVKKLEDSLNGEDEKEFDTAA